MGNIGSGRISGSTGGSGGGGGTSTVPFQQFNLTKDANTFDVTSFIINPTSCKVFVDGILLPIENYTIIENSVGTYIFISDGSIVTITN